MGKIIQLGDHLWTMPDSPTSQDDVLFVKEKKSEQYWQRQKDIPDIFFRYNRLAALNTDRTSYNDDGIMLSISGEDAKTVQFYLDREMRRRTEGVWFMNNGNLTYLTGAHYFMLQYGSMPGHVNDRDGSSYGDYREFQGNLHYFLKMCKDDKRCGGAFIGKAKKTGITNLMAIDFVEESTRYKEKRLGMMSKTGNDAQYTNFMYYLHCFDNLPMVFQPSVSNRGEKFIKFDNPKVKSTGTRNALLKQLINDGFNSQVFAANTVANGFDGPKMFRAMCDEISKYIDPYPKDVFDASKETVKQGTKITGKLWLFCYPPEKDGKNLTQAEKIWKDSAWDTFDSLTERTKSGLYNYFIPITQSGEEQFDRYGICNEEKAKKIYQAKRDQLKDDPDALQAETRQYPMIEEEMWAEGGMGDKRFDPIRLGVQKIDLEKELRLHLPYEEGFLEWVDEKEFILDGPTRRINTNVYWRKITDEEKLTGVKAPFRWYLKETINPDTLNLPMRLFISGVRKKLEPIEDTSYGGAWDPTNYVDKNDVNEGSKHCGMVGNILDIAKDMAFGRPVTNQLLMIYHHRCTNPDDDLVNAIKLMLFWGCPFYVETNMTWMFTKLKQIGMGKFCLIRDPKKGLVPYDSQKHKTLPSTTEKVIIDYCNRIAAYIAQPKGNDVDYLKLLKDIVVIRQLLGFDMKNTKPYDAAVCFGFLRVHLDAMMEKFIKDRKNLGSSDGAGLISAMSRLIAPIPKLQQLVAVRK